MTSLFPVGSRDHASHTALQESDKARKMNAIYGPKCLEQFAKFSRHGLWARTFSELLIGTRGWYSTRCRLTWKLKGTKSNRMYFQLAPSTLPTDGTEFGLLPTPCVADTEGSPKRPDQISMKNGRFVRTSDNTGVEFGAKLNDVARPLPTPQAIDGLGTGRELRLKTGQRNPESPGNWRGDLKDYAFQGMLPTPTSKDEKNGCKQVPGGRIDRKIQQGWTVELNDLAVNGMLPTPATRDYKGGNSMEHLTRKDKSEGNSHQDQLPNFIKLATGETSQLNPLFVLEMMGFPVNHCDPIFEMIAMDLYRKKKSSKSFQQRIANGEKQSCKPQETP